MVRTERVKRAEMEAELKEARVEKDALRSALQLIEDENGRLRTERSQDSAVSSSITAPPPTLDPPDATSQPSHENTEAEALPRSAHVDALPQPLSQPRSTMTNTSPSGNELSEITTSLQSTLLSHEPWQSHHLVHHEEGHSDWAGAVSPSHLTPPVSLPETTPLDTPIALTS
jgi:hypothetical protein